MSRIQFREVGVSVPVWGERGQQHHKQLLSGITADLTERRIAIIGANGSGKSTLLRLLNGLASATSGQLLVDGIDPAKDPKAIRQKVGFIFTDPLSQLVMSTPADDLELSLRKRLKDRKQRRQRALEILDERGLGRVADQSIYDLSGGERQLVSMATVLAVEPDVVVADEPTTLLDLRNRLRVGEALMDLDQQLVVATHDLDLAARADRALVIEAGRCVFDGSPDAAIDHYRQLMHTPAPR
ncbi:energy-coupling factor ABC transporter ATP-binding protein [Luteococcus sp. Sow4_B9]|uniref:energy-coupling factor ABC transporter ATP-binding protein n=1 Tax=Luteococcus sp. Sow4_B9 TaxID=3438792 RepID=UPI003F984AD8